MGQNKCVFAHASFDDYYVLYWIIKKHALPFWIIQFGLITFWRCILKLKNLIETGNGAKSITKWFFFVISMTFQIIYIQQSTK